MDQNEINRLICEDYHRDVQQMAVTVYNLFDKQAAQEKHENRPDINFDPDKRLITLHHRDKSLTLRIDYRPEIWSVRFLTIENGSITRYDCARSDEQLERKVRMYLHSVL